MTAEEPDPERLLAEALRAQAVRTPMPVQPERVDQSLPLLSGAEPGYGLLAGHDPATVRGPATPYQEHDTQARPEPGTTRLRARPRQTAAGWVLLFALVLGLAAGAAIALLTVY